MEFYVIRKMVKILTRMLDDQQLLGTPIKKEYTLGSGEDKIMIVEKYLDEILETQLKQYGLRYRFIKQIKEDIWNRICSLAIRYKSDDLYEILRFTVMEEAQFYRPKADLEIRVLTVAAIRNSKLEIAASVSCGAFKMPEPLSDEAIKSITQEAIGYFGQFTMEEIREECKNKNFTDVFGQGAEKYPLAAGILKRAALMPGTVAVMPENETEAKTSDFEHFNIQDKVAICDGYTLSFDTQLTETLGMVLSGKVDYFYVDSFKMLSRNFEKILHILEILLEHDKVFLTPNYYISKVYLEKREKIIRAAHNRRDVFENSMYVNGAPPKIRELLSSQTDGQ